MRSIDADAGHKVPLLGFRPDAMSTMPVLDIGDVITGYYLRMKAEDKPGVLAEVSAIFAEHSISIEAVLQKEPAAGEHEVDLIMLSQKVREQSMNTAIAEIEKLPHIDGEVIRIRMEHLD